MQQFANKYGKETKADSFPAILAKTVFCSATYARSPAYDVSAGAQRSALGRRDDGMR